MSDLFTVIQVRNLLMAELNLGVWHAEDWNALYLMAQSAGCENIACQVKRYILHYGEGA